MVGQILANAGKIDERLDPQGSELSCVTDSRIHHDLCRSNGACRENDFVLRFAGDPLGFCEYATVSFGRHDIS